MPKPELPRAVSKSGRSLVTRDAWGITYSQLTAIVAIMAAESVGIRGVTRRELESIGALVGDGSHIGDLEKRRWVVCIGRGGANGQERLWAPHPRAWRELGFERERVSA